MLSAANHLEQYHRRKAQSSGFQGPVADGHTAKANRWHTHLVHHETQKGRLEHIATLQPSTQAHKLAVSQYQLAEANHYRTKANTPGVHDDHNRQEYNARAAAYELAGNTNAFHAANPNALTMGVYYPTTVIPDHDHLDTTYNGF